MSSVSARSPVLPAGSMRTEALLSYAIAAFPGAVFFLSPLFSWTLSLLALALLSEFITPRSRLVLAVTAVISGAVMFASRAYGVTTSDDFQVYYPMYLGLANGEWDLLFTFGGGLEIALGLVFAGLSFVLGPASPTAVMLCVMILAGGVFLLWLEKYALSYTSEEKRGLMTAFSIVFFSFFLASQTVRQFLSCVILLLALFEPRRRVAYAYLILATAFHLSAIPVYLFFAAVRKWRWWGVLGGVAVAYGAMTQFGKLVQIVADGVGIYGADKLLIYAEGFEGFTETDLAPLRWLFVALCVGILARLVGGAGARDRRDVFPIFVAFFLLHVVLLPIPLASIRSTMLITSVTLGWFIFMFCDGIHRAYLKIFFGLILVWKVRGFLFLQPDDPFRLWIQYDWLGFLPGYFLL